MTTNAMIKCSAMDSQGFSFFSLEIVKLSMANIDKPQITLTTIATESSMNKTGTIKVNAKRNLVKNVEIVDVHISFFECTFSDSSET